MQLFKSIYLLFIVLIISSCIDCTKSIGNNTLFNVWVKYDDDWNDPNTFRSANKLDENRPGFIIESDGTFIQRQNVSWCGTPPITYGNYEGTWKELSEDTLQIIVDFWGGVDTFKIEILSVNDSELVINYVYKFEENE